MKGQRSKRKKEEKENNEGACPDSARRDSNLKAEGFRIRKKLQTWIFEFFDTSSLIALIAGSCRQLSLND